MVQSGAVRWAVLAKETDRWEQHLLKPLMLRPDLLRWQLSERIGFLKAP